MRKIKDEKINVTVKMEMPSPTLLEENHKAKKSDFVNFALNNLCLEKTKFSTQGSVSWKVFLLPSIIHFPFVGKKHMYILDLI